MINRSRGNALGPGQRSDVQRARGRTRCERAKRRRVRRHRRARSCGCGDFTTRSLTCRPRGARRSASARRLSQRPARSRAAHRSGSRGQASRSISAASRKASPSKSRPTCCDAWRSTASSTRAAISICSALRRASTLWTVGIKDPDRPAPRARRRRHRRDVGLDVGRLRQLRRAANGRTYGHILDPHTLAPVGRRAERDDSLARRHVGRCDVESCLRAWPECRARPHSLVLGHVRADRLSRSRRQDRGDDVAFVEVAFPPVARQLDRNDAASAFSAISTWM